MENLVELQENELREVNGGEVVICETWMQIGDTIYYFEETWVDGVLESVKGVGSSSVC